MRSTLAKLLALAAIAVLAACGLEMPQQNTRPNYAYTPPTGGSAYPGHYDNCMSYPSAACAPTYGNGITSGAMQMRP
jgi:hypothetical protein